MLNRGGHHHFPNNCHHHQNHCHHHQSHCHHHQSHCHHHQHRDHHNPPQANSWSPPRRTSTTSWTTSSFTPAHSCSVSTRVSAFVLEIRSDMMTKRIVLVMAMMTMRAVVIMIWNQDTLNRPPSLNKQTWFQQNCALCGADGSPQKYLSWLIMTKVNNLKS